MLQRHPYATAIALPPFSYDTPHSIIRANHRMGEEKNTMPAPKKQAPGPPPVRRKVVRRRSGRFIANHAGVTLTLNGQAHGARCPTYSQGGTVDGLVEVTNPVGVLRIEAKIEGFVEVFELAGNGKARSEVLSEVLALWEYPKAQHDANLFAGTDGDGAEYGYGCFAKTSKTSVVDLCPRVLPFKTVLPTHYTDLEGDRYELPPSFYERLPSFPGFKGDVRYSITITVTKLRDMGLRWKKNTVMRTLFEYIPLTRPSGAFPFPYRSKSKGGSHPVTKFSSTIESNDPLQQQVTSQLYLPTSQSCPMHDPIPFFLKLSGPEDVIELFSQDISPPSFLPTLSSDIISTVLRGHYRAPSTATSATSSSTESHHSEHSDSSSSNRPDLPKIRVMLIRQVSVNTDSAGLYTPSPLHPSKSQLHKSSVIGEGVLYASRVKESSITFSGEVSVDPRSGVRCAGFNTKNLAVRDMLVVSITQPRTANIRLKDFRQVVPIHFTTDAYASKAK